MDKRSGQVYCPLKFGKVGSGLGFLNLDYLHGEPSVKRCHSEFIGISLYSPNG
jgi:hypothetical protein